MALSTGQAKNTSIKTFCSVGGRITALPAPYLIQLQQSKQARQTAKGGRLGAEGTEDPTEGGGCSLSTEDCGWVGFISLSLISYIDELYSVKLSGQFAENLRAEPKKPSPERRGRVGAGDALKAMDGFTNLGIGLYPLSPLFWKVLDYSDRYNISAYDAAYAALADDLKTHVVTADKRLFNATRKLRVVKWIGEFRK